MTITTIKNNITLICVKDTIFTDFSTKKLGVYIIHKNYTINF